MRVELENIAYDIPKRWRFSHFQQIRSMYFQQSDRQMKKIRHILGKCGLTQNFDRIFANFRSLTAKKIYTIAHLSDQNIVLKNYKKT